MSHSLWACAGEGELEWALLTSLPVAPYCIKLQTNIGYYGYPLAHFPEFSWELKQVRVGEGHLLQGVGDPTQPQCHL